MDEQAFQAWYKGWAAKLGLDPNPDAKEHYYDWRGAYKEGATPDAENHWPSKFKLEGHPNLIVNGQDTRTGKPVMATPPQDGMDAGGGGSLGQLIQGPQGFVQGPPPANESEFQQNFNEMRTFLKDPAIRSALGQFAIAMFQPRAPGQTLVGHTGQAAGQAGMAANRVMTQEEELRKTQTKEMENQQQIEQAQQRIALGEKELGQKAEFHKDDVRLREKSIAVSEANSRRLAGAEAARIAADERRYGRELDLRAFDAASKAELERAKKAEGDLATLDPKSPDYAAAKAAAQYNPENVSRYYESFRSTINPKERAKAEADLKAKRDAAPAFTDEELNTSLATKEGFRKMTDMVRRGERKFTKDQFEKARKEAAILDTPDVITEKPVGDPKLKGTDFRSAEGVMDDNAKASFLEKLNKAHELPGVPGTRYTMSDLEKGDELPGVQERILGQVSAALPATAPKDADTWRMILDSDIATFVAKEKYGERVVLKAQRQLNMKASPSRAQKRADEVDSEGPKLRLKIKQRPVEE